MSIRQAGPATVFVLAVAVTAAAWTSWLLSGRTLGGAVESYLLTNSAMALTFTAFGTFVLAHRPGQRIGALFVAYGLCYVAALAALGVLVGPFGLSSAAERAVTLFAVAVWIPAPAIVLPLILQLFPDGHLLSPRWRPLVPLTAVAGFGLVAALVLQPDIFADQPIADRSPLLTGALAQVMPSAAPVLVVLHSAVALCSAVALVLRLRRSAGVHRSRLLWLAWAVAAFVVLNTQRIVTADGPILLLLTLPLIPAAATVAILRHELYDIRLVINRSVVYVALTVGVVGGYLGIVAVLSALVRDRLPAGPVLATAVVAVAFAPARAWMQSLVDRAMYGERRDPAAAAARVGVRLADGLDGVLRAVCDALRLPFAAISSDRGLVAAVGTSTGLRHTVALHVGEGAPADLLVGLRSGESRASTADARALGMLAAPVGVAVQAVRLSAQLQESRARIVAAREEERRRLRRDLHDGLGTALTAVTLKADAAHNLQQVDLARSGELLLALRADLTTAIADIRRLVYDLRPPDLDELGLVGALRQHAEQSWRRPDGRFTVTIDAPPDLPALPAAVEVAVYRIATEAVTNALRHGDARICVVSLHVDTAVHLQVTDDATGGTGPWRPGVGLRSMYERAAELGGSVTAGPTDHGGNVHVVLPLEAP